MARVEAVLLVAGSALTFRRLAQLATLADLSEAREIVSRLNESYDRTGSAFRIETLATGVRLLTRPQFALWLDRVHQRQARLKLSSPMLETLAIVAYRQPVTRAEVEKIRGVQSSDMLKQLMDRGLVRIVGEDESLGRPFLYGTSRQFLEEFGLSSLDEMPGADVLLRKAADVPRTPEEAAEVRWERNDPGAEASADDSEAA
jgi:segregation and condensation protein B